MVAKFLANFHEREQRIDKLKAVAKAAGVEQEPFEELSATLRDKGYDSDMRDLRVWMWVQEKSEVPTVVVSVSSGAEESKLLRNLWQTATKALCGKKILVAANGAPELAGQKASCSSTRATVRSRCGSGAMTTSTCSASASSCCRARSPRNRRRCGPASPACWARGRAWR